MNAQEPSTGPFQARIAAFAHGGDGLARPEGRPVTFIEGVVPGDLVLVETTERARGFERARLVEVLEPGPGRREPPCPEAGLCGGCQWQHVEESTQATAATALLEEALRRTGRLDLTAVDLRPPIVPSATLSYRQRARFHVDLEANPPVIGFHQRGSHAIHGPRRCLVLSDELERLRGALERTIAGAGKLLPGALDVELGVDAPAPGSALALLTLRLRGRPAAGALEAACRLLLGSDEALRGVAAIATGPTGGTARALAGAPRVTFATGTTEEPQGARAWLAPGSFLQASAEGARLIASTVLAALGEALGPLAGVAVLELHAGNGTLTLPLASQGARVTAVESDARSAAGLAESAARAGVPVEVLAADAARETARLAASGRRFRAVVLDPPRTGAREAVAGIAALAPEAIVHVSCDAATFARDAGALVAAGFVLRHVRPLLLFPQTAHFETVALFERGGQGGA